MYAIRDDVSTSLSTAERNLIISSATRHHPRHSSNDDHDSSSNTNNPPPRVDGRGPYDRRPVQLDLVRGDNRAVATVKLGAGTRVTATIVGELGPPASTDRPNEGSVAITVDLSPVASTAYRHATPAMTTGAGSRCPQSQPVADRHQKLTANRILRCLERCLLNSGSGNAGGALDAEALCVVPGRFVWKLNIRVTVLDAAGNLTDAAVLACLAAVRHYRKPCTETSSANGSAESHHPHSEEVPRLVPANFKEPTPLPLHHTPLTITLALFLASPYDEDDDTNETKTGATNTTTTTALLVDPTHREELCQTGQVTLALNAYQELCWLDFSGGCEISVADLRRCYRHAVPHAMQLSQSLEQTLQAADDRARQERLTAALLQKQQKQQQQQQPLPQLPSSYDSKMPNVPFWQTAPEQSIETNLVADRAAAEAEAAAAAAAAAQDEVYRQRALDYNVGHVATQVRENRDQLPPDSRRAPNSLLTALLQSVQPSQSPPPAQPATASASTMVVPPVPTPDSVPVRASHATFTTPATARTASAATAAGSTKTAPRTDVSRSARNASPTIAATLDDDDDEVTLQQQSEFQTISGAIAVPPPTLPSNSTRITATPTLEANKDDDDDVDDLAAAIKIKSSKKKKKR